MLVDGLGVDSLTLAGFPRHSRNLCIVEIVIVMRISSWNFVRVPKAMLWAHEQCFSLKFSPYMQYLALCIFGRIFWRAREMFVKQPPGSWLAKSSAPITMQDSLSSKCWQNDRKCKYTYAAKINSPQGLLQVVWKNTSTTAWHHIIVCKALCPLCISTCKHQLLHCYGCINCVTPYIWNMSKILLSEPFLSVHNIGDVVIYHAMFLSLSLYQRAPGYCRCPSR